MLYLYLEIFRTGIPGANLHYIKELWLTELQMTESSDEKYRNGMRSIWKLNENFY